MVLVSTGNVDCQCSIFPDCVARWGARGESGLRNFERLPSQVSHISKYVTGLRIYPKKIIIIKENRRKKPLLLGHLFPEEKKWDFPLAHAQNS